MNIQIYTTILTLAVTLIVLGYYQKDNADIFKVSGFFFLFLVSVLLIPGTPGSLEYRDGKEITYIYDVNNVTTGTIEEYVYETYESFTIGFFLSCVAIFGFINVYVSRQGSGGFGNE